MSKTSGGVILLGNRTDVDRLYQAMDVFVFPSRYEGLGMAAVEAQICGLWVVASSAVPDEAVISERMCRLSLSTSIGIWADMVMLPIRTGKGI